MLKFGRVAQLVEQVTFNHWVTGSNPVALTTIRFVETYILQQIGWRPYGFEWTVQGSVGHPTPEIPAYTGKNSAFHRELMTSCKAYLTEKHTGKTFVGSSYSTFVHENGRGFIMPKCQDH